MLKFLIYISVLVFAITISWHYLPPHIREKAAAFVGIARKGDKQEVKRFIEEVILPPDPKKRREVLLKELKKNITEVKQRFSNKTKDNAPAKTSSNESSFASASSGELIGSAEDLIKELEEANDDASIGEKITERIIDTILPPQSTMECKVKN